MTNNELGENERIRDLMAEALANRLNPYAIHEAGHAVVALHLGLPLESVDIEQRDEPDGLKFGRTKVQPITDSFSANEFRERSPLVIERVRKQVTMLLAGEAATMLLRARPSDPLAQCDQSDIRSALREFPELEDDVILQELLTSAREIVTMRRVDIERLASALADRIVLNAAEVRQVIGA
jgi:hypothetical protein